MEKGNFQIDTGMYLSYRETLDEAVQVAKKRSTKLNRKVRVKDIEYGWKVLYECEDGKVYPIN